MALQVRLDGLTAFPARLARCAVRIYQWLRVGRPSPCRFVPSCSEYALEALECHGFLKGGWLSALRLCRCHPWGGMGWDPVPVDRTSPVNRTSRHSMPVESTDV